MLDWTEHRVVVTGGSGFLGRQVHDRLVRRGARRVFTPRRSQYDLTRASDVETLYDDCRPDVVVHLAAEVGGIGANREHPGRFFFANMAMGLNLVEEARRRRIRKFVQIGTVCAYPKFAPIPFREDDLWNGYPEETNAPYGIAKKAMFVMLDAYHREYGLPGVVVVPVNLYGPGDNFDPRTSHVIPALIRKCSEAVRDGAESITCWGTGKASREFLYVDDAADGVVAAAEIMEEPIPINLGNGREITIHALVEKIAQTCGFSGEIHWDSEKPDGQPRRCLDVSRAKELLGWEAKIRFEEGIERTVEWCMAQE